MYDDKCVITQAQGLPAGWEWHEWDDGSGGLHSPDGKTFMEYDAQTREYRYKNDHWCFFDGYPYDPESLASVKERAESYAKNMLAREISVQEPPKEQHRAAKTQGAR